MKVGVVVFPGSNCDRDCLRAFSLLGVEAVPVWHQLAALPAVDLVVLPGGFSYGDYLRPGALASQSAIMGDIRRFAERGGPVLGICNGFQILCETHLLEGALLRNAGLTFECKNVDLLVSGRPTPFTSRIAAGRVLTLPIAHADGRYHHENPASLFERSLVVFRYVDEAGGVTPGANPNGSVENIAGITNERGNVLGLMPHPERATEAILGGVDGLLVLGSAVASISSASTSSNGSGKAPAVSQKPEKGVTA